MNRATLPFGCGHCAASPGYWPKVHFESGVRSARVNATTTKRSARMRSFCRFLLCDRSPKRSDVRGSDESVAGEQFRPERGGLTQCLLARALVLGASRSHATSA